MHDFPLITTVAAAFTAAWVLGLITQWLRMSPIVGYLLAGVLIGPNTPGYVGDINLANQLAEVGVILLMFGVGLHFHLKDLLAVKSVAIPGALGQSIGATVACIAVFHFFGFGVTTAAVIGMAMAVASTVVLMRVLMDAGSLHSPAGHVAVGWLLVEDLLTVVVVVLIPTLAASTSAVGAEVGAREEVVILLKAIGIAFAKLGTLIAIVAFVGSRVIPWALNHVARLRSRELFTLTVMVFSVAIAAGSYELFGASMALGAFLAGMVVALSPVSHQAAADALPLRDAFAVLFFVAVGMLFEPAFLVERPLMMLAAMGVILLVKPLFALVIVVALGHSLRTALTVALALAQIGEFSFILSAVAREHNLMPDDGHNVLVGGAILSITLNPILFRQIDRIEGWLRRHPRLWALLNARSERQSSLTNAAAAKEISQHDPQKAPLAIVVGYGPVGRTVDRLLSDAGLETVILDMNMDTVNNLHRQGRKAVYGDATREPILESAGIEKASHLVLTLPQATSRATVIFSARSINPRVKILVRAHYLGEREELEQLGATAAIFEEAEAAVALARLVLVDRGAGRDRIEHAVREIRMQLVLDNINSLQMQGIRSIMVPWDRVRKLSAGSSLDEVRRQVSGMQSSRWLVTADEDGSPLGFLLAKDLIGLKADEGSWNELIQPVGTIGPDDDIESALRLFQRDGGSVCVVSEGGVPVGIVTLEDILEQVVGRIETDADREQQIGGAHR